MVDLGKLGYFERYLGSGKWFNTNSLEGGKLKGNVGISPLTADTGNLRKSILFALVLRVQFWTCPV